MSFVDEEDVFAAWELALRETFAEVMGVELAAPFLRLTWREAMERFGVDKPDLRFESDGRTFPFSPPTSCGSVEASTAART